MTVPNGSEVTAAAQPAPEIVALLEELGTDPAPALHTLSPAGARDVNKALFPTPDDPEPVGDVMDLTVGEDGVPVRVYVPEGEGPYPTLVYFHGGGWVLGTLDRFEAPCRALASGADCMVVSVDYRRAPEHQFPAPLEDCYAALEWVFETAGTMQVDTDNVAVGGDSAGGNLAAAVAQLARDREGPDPAHQVLVYPVTDHAFDTPSYGENAEGYLLEKPTMEWFWDHYLPSDVHGKNPYASPLRVRDLGDLPPATVVTCGFDPLRDEGAAYAGRLADAGVDVDHVHYEDAIHGIFQMLVEPMAVPQARDLVDDVVDSLRTAFR